MKDLGLYKRLNESLKTIEKAWRWQGASVGGGGEEEEERRRRRRGGGGGGGGGEEEEEERRSTVGRTVFFECTNYLYVLFLKQQQRCNIKCHQRIFF